VTKKLIFNILKFAVFLSLGIFLLWLITKDYTEEQWTDFKNALFHANYWWVAFAVLIGLLSHLIRALRWNMMIEPLGYRPRLKTTFYSVMIAYLANMAIPRLGEVTRCGILQRYEKVPFDKALGTIVVERAIDLLSLIIITLLLFIFQFDLIYDFFDEKVIIPLGEKIAQSNNLLLIVAIVFVVCGIAVWYFIKKFKHTDLYLRIRILLLNVREGVYSIRHLKNFWLFLFYSVFMWFCYYAMVWVCFYAMAQTAHLGMAEALSVLVFGTVGIIATPGGIGAYHIIVTETLVALYGLQETYANSFSWLAWGCQTAMIILIGLLSLLLLSRLSGKETVHEKVAGDTSKNN